MSSSKFGFSIGDRVLFIDDIDPDGQIVCGETGEVCDLDNIFGEDSVGVRWDKKESDRHGCSGKCSEHHGWWVPYYSIQKIDIDLGEFQCGDTPLSFLIDI